MCTCTIIQVGKYSEALSPPMFDQCSLNLGEKIGPVDKPRTEKSMVTFVEERESQELTMQQKNLYVVVATLVIKFKKPITLGKQVCSSSYILIFKFTRPQVMDNITQFHNQEPCLQSL